MQEIDDRTIAAYVDAAASALGIAVDPAWKPAIEANLKVTLGLGLLVAEFDLPDESEPAPIFEA